MSSKLCGADINKNSDHININTASNQIIHKAIAAKNFIAFTANKTDNT